MKKEQLEGGTMDLSDHVTTYQGFLTLTKWGTVAVALVLLFLLFFVY